MVEKQIEQEVEVTETVTETVVYCDGCTHDCTDEPYTTFSNIDPDSIMKAYRGPAPGQRLQTIAEESETFQLCPGCQEGLKTHGDTIDAAIHGGSSDESDDDSLLTAGRLANVFWLVSIALIFATTWANSWFWLVPLAVSWAFFFEFVDVKFSS